jgi:hypothetical protein
MLASCRRTSIQRPPLAARVAKRDAHQLFPMHGLCLGNQHAFDRLLDGFWIAVRGEPLLSLLFRSPLVP